MHALDDKDIGRRAIRAEAHDHVWIQISEAATRCDAKSEREERAFQAADRWHDDFHVGRQVLGLLGDDRDAVSTVQTVRQLPDDTLDASAPMASREDEGHVKSVIDRCSHVTSRR
jgi:hypothetical protein